MEHAFGLRANEILLRNCPFSKEAREINSQCAQACWRMSSTDVKNNLLSNQMS